MIPDPKRIEFLRSAYQSVNLTLNPGAGVSMGSRLRLGEIALLFMISTALTLIIEFKKMKKLVCLLLFISPSLLIGQLIDPVKIPTSEYEIRDEIDQIKNKVIPDLDSDFNSLQNLNSIIEQDVQRIEDINYDLSKLNELNASFKSNDLASYSVNLNSFFLPFREINPRFYIDDFPLREFDAELKKHQDEINTILSELGNSLYFDLRSKLREISVDTTSIRSLHDQFVDKYSKDFLDGLKSRMTAELNKTYMTLESKIKSNRSLKEDFIEKLNQLRKVQEKTKGGINLTAIKLGLPLFCATIALLFLGPMIIQAISGNRIQIQGRSSSDLLELITVFLLTMTILILGLGNILESEVLGTLIGGISGYVLNKISTKKAEGESKKA